MYFPELGSLVRIPAGMDQGKLRILSLLAQFERNQPVLDNFAETSYTQGRKAG
jgi:hypothetical protein